MKNFLDDLYIPAAVGIPVFAGVIVCAILASFISAKRATTVAERRARNTPATSTEKRTERRLMIMAVVPTMIVWAAVFVISFIGLAAFARHDMGWHSWTSLVVPITLDGIALSQGASAFVAVKRGRSSRRAERAVLAGALVSAAINFYHGANEWTWAAGAYLGFLSLAGMWLFHDLLRQFAEDVEEQQIKRKRKVGTPAFGERWLWAPISTLCARRAWIIWPPANESMESTVANALKHWQAFKDHKKISKGAGEAETAAQIELKKIAAEAEVDRAAAERDAFRSVPARTGPQFVPFQPVPAGPVNGAPAGPEHRNGTVERQNGTPERRPALPGPDRTGPSVPPFRSGANDRARQARTDAEEIKNRTQLQKIMDTYPGKNWEQIRSENSQNKMQAATKIRKERLVVLLFSGDGLAESYFPDPLNPAPANADQFDTSELAQLLDREAVPTR